MGYKYKRAGLIGVSLFIAIVAMLILMKCSSTEAVADPIGPPTLETYLININSNIQIFKWMAGGMSALFTLLIAAVVYAYKRDIKEVSKKADSAFKEINNVKRDFLSTTNHDRACPHIGTAVEPGH